MKIRPNIAAMRLLVRLLSHPIFKQSVKNWDMAKLTENPFKSSAPVLHDSIKALKERESQDEEGTGKGKVMFDAFQSEDEFADVVLVGGKEQLRRCPNLSQNLLLKMRILKKAGQIPGLFGCEDSSSGLLIRVVLK